VQPTSIRLVPLPSAQDPDLEAPIVRPTSHKLNFGIADLTMDPSQDLIVVSEYRVGSTDGNRLAPTHRYHLLTLSSFKPHPLAKVPFLDFPPASQGHAQTRQLLQVMGDTLVILVSRFQIHWLLAGLAGNGPIGSEEEIVCWNWKTGKVLAVRNTLLTSGRLKLTCASACGCPRMVGWHRLPSCRQRHSW
jgi:hypothetical protein